MKQFLLIVVVAIAMGVTGCATKAVVAPVPGQINTFDAYAFRVLADAQAAINAFKADVQSGKVTETPAIKAALNQAITDYDAAEAAYQIWHATGGAGSTAALTVQINKLPTDIAITAGGAN